jgi:hypothetical protein
MPFSNFPLLSPSHPLSIFLPISLAISIFLTISPFVWQPTKIIQRGEAHQTICRALRIKKQWCGSGLVMSTISKRKHNILIWKLIIGTKAKHFDLVRLLLEQKQTF